MSNADFKRNYAKLLQRAGARAEAVARKTGLELLSSLILKSPVKTGRFRGAWQVGDRKIDTSTYEGGDPTGAGATARGAAQLQSIQLGGVIFLTNSLPYAYRLEHGWSQQAPQGMVKLTVAEYSQHIANVVRSLK